MSFKIADAYVEVRGRVDEPSHRRAAEAVGRRAGDSFATAFGMSANRRWRRMTRVFMEPINAVSSALSAIRGPSLRGGIVSTILALIPSAGKAATALGASLIPALLSLGSVIGVTRLMLGKLQSDIKGQTLKALNDMAGSVRQLAREAAKPGLNALLEGVVRNGPLFETYIQRIAKAIGNALGEVGHLLGNQGFVAKLNSLLEQSAESTAIWTRSLDDVVEMLVTLGDAASPIFHDMAVRVNTLTDRWRDFLNLKYETGELQQFLSDAAEELARWGRIFNNVIIGLYNLFAAGVGPSSQFAESLERMTASFREWTTHSENVEKVRRFFQFLVDNVDTFFRVAASALLIAGALKGIGAAMEVIDFARLLFQLGTMGIVLGVAGLAIAGIAASFMLAYNSSELFRTKVDELWQKVQNDLFPILQEWWAWIKEELAPALQDFALRVLAGVSEAFDTLIQKYKENEEGIKQFRDLLVDLLPVAAFVVQGIITEITGLVSAFMTGIGWAGRLVGAIKKIPGKTITKYLFQPGAALSWIGRVTGATKAIPKAWKTVYKFLSGGVAAAISKVKGWLASIPRSITTTITTIRQSILDFVNPFGGASGGLMGGGRGMASGGIGGGRPVLVGEQGPELVNLPFGSKVTPAGQTRATMGAGSGPAEVILRIESGGTRLDDFLVDLLRKAVRSRGGDVQIVLGSR